MPTNLDRNAAQDDARSTTPSFLPITPDPTTQAASPQADEPKLPETDALPACASGQLTDEEQAYRSLDDTIMRIMPTNTALWEAVEADSRPPLAQVEPARPSRVRTAVLVGAVAAVSFVAGGVTARLSAQMPVLFAQKPQVTETLASYEEPQVEIETTPVTQVTPEVEPEQQPTPTPPSYDTGYDTTDDTPTSTVDTLPNTQTDDNHTITWDLDSEGTEKITYDYDSDQVTLDYEGYSLTVPIGELIGYDQQAPGSRRRYGFGTGYDTEEDRDRDSWGTPRSNGWYGAYHT